MASFYFIFCVVAIVMRIHLVFLQMCWLSCVYVDAYGIYWMMRTCVCVCVCVMSADKHDTTFHCTYHHHLNGIPFAATKKANVRDRLEREELVFFYKKTNFNRKHSSSCSNRISMNHFGISLQLRLPIWCVCVCVECVCVFWYLKLYEKKRGTRWAGSESTNSIERGTASYRMADEWIVRCVLV